MPRRSKSDIVLELMKIALIKKMDSSRQQQWKPHWSYITTKKLAQPQSLQMTEWPQNPIDYFHVSNGNVLKKAPIC